MQRNVIASRQHEGHQDHVLCAPAATLEFLCPRGSRGVLSRLAYSARRWFRSSSHAAGGCVSMADECCLTLFFLALARQYCLALAFPLGLYLGLAAALAFRRSIGFRRSRLPLAALGFVVASRGRIRRCGCSLETAKLRIFSRFATLRTTISLEFLPISRLRNSRLRRHHQTDDYQHSPKRRALQTVNGYRD